MVPRRSSETFVDEDCVVVQVTDSHCHAVLGFYGIQEDKKPPLDAFESVMSIHQ